MITICLNHKISANIFRFIPVCDVKTPPKKIKISSKKNCRLTLDNGWVELGFDIGSACSDAALIEIVEASPFLIFIINFESF